MAANIEEKTSETKNKVDAESTLPAVTSRRLLRLELCHRFHSNPSVSFPNFSRPSPSTPSARLTYAHNNANTSKAFKRKQRLAQYKAANNANISTLADVTDNATPHHSMSSSSGMHYSINHNNNNGQTCHATWASNSNFQKHVDLLAIATSPNSPNLNNSLSGSQQIPAGSNTSNGCNNSQVYILVFEEGSFMNRDDMTMWIDFCDFLGLPPPAGAYQDISSSKHDKDDRMIGSVEQRNETALLNMEDDYPEVVGIKRDMFQFVNGTTEFSEDDPNRNSLKDIIPGNRMNSSGGFGTKLENISIRNLKPIVISPEKITENADIALSLNFLEQLILHIWKEIKHCFSILYYEIFSDGRIFGNETTTRRGRKKRSKKVNPIDGDGPTSQESENDHSHHDPNFMEVQRTPSFPLSQNYIKTSSLVKPTIAFQVVLPFSTSIMEVSNLEWDADGTTLSIVQKRKGQSSSGSYIATSSGAQSNNKKKSNYINSSAVISGNTAVSFWSVPEWLLSDFDDEGYDSDDHFEDEDYGNRQQSLSRECGWEDDCQDNNKALLPMWEWYLAKYVFKDYCTPISDTDTFQRRTLSNTMIDVPCVPLELSASSSSSSQTSSSLGVSRNPKRAGLKNSRGTNVTSDNASIMMNGDVTCLFWERTTKQSSNGRGDKHNKTTSGSSWFLNEFIEISEINKDKKLEMPSKWMVLGTSKGQVILHNFAASYFTHQSRKSKKGQSVLYTKILPKSCSTQSRTITLPCRHKKRITCGAWVDNLLVFGSVGSGTLTAVSTFPKSDSDQVITNKLSDDIFREKSIKVLGNIDIPGGLDPYSIIIDSIKADKCDTTILSVNCEAKSLLFYTFPKVSEQSKANNQALVTSPATAFNFTLSSGNLCGNIMQHFLIPNMCFTLVAFSSGIFALCDWANGTILSDVNSSNQPLNKSSKSTSSLSAGYSNTDELTCDDEFLIDVAFHTLTCAFACLTKSGYLIVYQVRLFSGGLNGRDCTRSSGLVMGMKTHTRPKTKSSSLNSSDQSSSHEASSFKWNSAGILGTIDYLCSHKVDFVPSVLSDSKKGSSLVSFSSDGTRVSVCLGDETVSVFSVRVDERDINKEKVALMKNLFSGKDHFLVSLLLFGLCTIVALHFLDLLNNYRSS